MKKLPASLGYITLLFTAMFAVFKFVRIPGANVIMLIAGLLIAIYFPLLFLKELSDKSKNKTHPVHCFGAALLAILIISVILKFQHWAPMIYPGDRPIKLFSVPPIVFNLAYYGFSLLFIPWLIWYNYKVYNASILKNLIGGLGLALISISLYGYQIKAAHHHTLFIIGNVLFVIIYLPVNLFLSERKEPEEELHNTFRTLIIGYVLILFIYGVFLEWPLTYQDVLLKK